MHSYWKQLFRTAWTDTKQSLGLNQKTAATALVAVGTIIVAGLQYGWVALIHTAGGYFWIAFAPTFAGFCLFAWNFVTAQATIAQTSKAKIADLETKIARKVTRPNYTAWRHVHAISLRNAAFLWCDLEPSEAMSPSVQAWLNAFKSAIQRGELDFVFQYSDTMGGDRERQRRRQRQNAYSDTFVTRDQLKEFAKKHNYDPPFLRDS